MAEINIDKMAHIVAEKAIQELRDNGVFVSRWIPCSEGLPKKDGKYLTTILNEYDNELRYVMTCYYFHDYWCPDDECASSNVIAWMPLPEPYETGK